MNPIENDFFDEFRDLEEICLQIYGRSPDGKLGVTQYLNDMKENEATGSITVPDWRFQYKRLRECRNKRNNLVHPRNDFDTDACSQDDVDFLISFRQSILNRTDPLAILNRLTISTRQPSTRYTAAYDELENSDDHNSLAITALLIFAGIGVSLLLTFLIFFALLSDSLLGIV